MTAMDCADALEWLEAEELDLSGDVPEEYAQAHQHLEACPLCQAAWPQRQVWARSLSAAMTQVEIPAGLRERLQAAIQPVSVAPAPQRSPHRSRRMFPRFLAAVTTVTAILLLATIAPRWWPQTQPVSLADLYAAGTVEVINLPEFQGDFSPRLPESWTAAFSLDPTLVRGFPREGLASGQVALVPFQIAARGKPEPLRGRLVILPRNQLVLTPPADPGRPTSRKTPQHTLSHDFGAAEVRYIPGQQGALVMWAEDDLVFACLIPSGPADLHRLQQLLTRGRSLT